MSIRETYGIRYNNILHPLAERLEKFLKESFSEVERIDRISVRAKSIDRFVDKSEKKNDLGSLKYTDPINQIQDQIGARVVCYYHSDVALVEQTALNYLRPIESRDVIPESQAEFGYFGKHFVFFLPDDVIEGNGGPKFFELQIKTLFQHAWSEAEHDLTYKPKKALPSDIHRKVAFTAAQAWGADMIFNELFLHVAANEGQL